jgi:sulfur carrier protein
MNIFLNGIPEVTKSKIISELISEKGLNPLTVIVELNAKIVRREFWESTCLAENDKIEILNFVGGG